MHQHFPHKISKQLDMDFRPSLTCLQKLGTLCLKRLNKLRILRPRSKSGIHRTVPADSVELTFHR